MPHISGRGTGDMYVEARITTPKKLSRKAKKLLSDLASELKDV